MSPSIIHQPVATSIEPGHTLKMFVRVSFSNGEFTWERNTGGGFAALVDGGRISGATTQNLVIADAVPGDAGIYRCSITAPTAEELVSSAVNVTVADYDFDPAEDHEPPAAGSATYSPAGAGSPEGVNYGIQGQSYWRTSNNTLYVKDSAGWGNTGWVLQGGGGGGAAENQSGSGSPVGVATPDYIGQWYLDTDTPSAVWISTGLTDADWLDVAGNL